MDQRKKREINKEYFSFGEYCGFIIIRWIPIFVDFVGTGEPRIQMFNENEFTISRVCKGG